MNGTAQLAYPAPAGSPPDPARAATPAGRTQGRSRRTALEATAERPWVRAVLIGTALLFLTLFLFMPLVVVFVEAFKKAAGFRPNFMAVGGYDGMHLIYEAR